MQFIRNTQTTTQKPASDYLPAGSGGVLFDIVGYHTYRNKNQNTLVTDEAFYNDYDTSKSSLGTKTSGGAIGMLKQFALPIHINEFNCNEIYGRDSDFPFDNVSGSQSMNKCLDSINKHLPAIVNSGAVEILDMFQLLDQPGHGYECKDPDNYTGTSQRICPAICLDALPKTNPASKCNENNINYSANLQNPAVWDPPAGNPYSGRIADGETRFGMFYTKFTTALTGSGGTAKLTYSILRNDFSQPKPAFSILKKYADTYNDDTQFITLPNGAVISF